MKITSPFGSISVCALSILLTLALVVLVFSPSFAEQWRLPPREVEDPSRQTQLTNSQNWQEFLSTYGRDWRVVWDESSEVPTWVYGGKPIHLGAPTSATHAEDLIRKFISHNQPLLKLSPDCLLLREVLHNKGKWYVRFTQVYRGVPIYGSKLSFTISESGDLLRFGGIIYPDVSLRESYTVAEQQAVETAKEFVGFDISTDRLQEAVRLILPNL